MPILVDSFPITLWNETAVTEKVRNERMRIVFAIPAFFPYGTPYSSRALNLCRLLRDCGHEVILFCDYLSDEEYKKSRGIAEIEGIEFRYITENRTLLDKVTVPIRTPYSIDRYITENKIDVLITSQASNRIERIIKIAKRHDVPVVLESCEKFHPSNWRFGKCDYRYLQFKHCWKKVYSKVNAVIAISRYLQAHYMAQGIEAIRIPTILDVTSTKWSRKITGDKIIRFVFAGSLGNGKDRVAEMIEAISILPLNERKRVLFNIYGPSKKIVARQLGNKAILLDSLKDNIFIHPRVSQQEVSRILMENDFGIIIRPERESSKAGFPTKLAEYMEVGLPVFVNNTGDIELYVQDGKNGIVLKDSSVESVVVGLKKTLRLSLDEMAMLRMNARATAEQNFDYRVYAERIANLLNDLVK